MSSNKELDRKIQEYNKIYNHGLIGFFQLCENSRIVVARVMITKEKNKVFLPTKIVLKSDASDILRDIIKRNRVIFNSLPIMNNCWHLNENNSIINIISEYKNEKNSEDFIFVLNVLIEIHYYIYDLFVKERDKREKIIQKFLMYRKAPQSKEYLNKISMIVDNINNSKIPDIYSLYKGYNYGYIDSELSEKFII